MLPHMKEDGLILLIDLYGLLVYPNLDSIDLEKEKGKICRYLPHN